ncbi:extracellular solute-binding protein [Aliiglaciecola sp. SL4]|uniref:extracellular solute-binding protein n=1 Tax=Aliiglaciecola sp. SL4 TaxID=3239806 RepID=UPI00355AF189
MNWLQPMAFAELLRKRKMLWFLLPLVCIGSLSAKEQVLLVAEQHVPYIGINMPNQGYVHQIVSEAFNRQGIRVKIVYYPAARAQKLATEGKVDGVLPVYENNLLTDTFLYSKPFPGDVIGLLKRKDTEVSVDIDKKNINAIFSELRNYHFGLVRGSASEQLIEEAQYLSKQYVSNNLINIDKLYAKRIDFALIDKFSAGHLIVSQRPHMIGKLEFVYPPLVDKAFHIAFTKSNVNAQRYLELFNQGLASMGADGRLAEILAKHGFSISPFNEGKEANKTSLLIGTVNNADMLILKDLSSHFEASNPNIKLRWKVLDEGVLRKRLLTDLSIHAGEFDVMTIGSYEVPIWAKNDWIVPIDSLPQKYALDDIVESVKNDVSVNEQLYALPFYAESSVTYYRTDLFKQAGIVMPQQPTFEQIYDFANKLNSPEEGVYGICLRGKAGWGSNLALITTMVNSYGGSWFDLDWRPQIATKEWHNAVSMYVDLITKFGPPNAIDNNYIENLNLFKRGKCAIWIDASIAASALADSTQSELSRHIKMVNAPIALHKNGSNWLWTWSLAIPSSSSHKDAATKFAQWATSKEYIQLVAEKYGWHLVPQGTRKSLYENEAYIKAAPFAPVVMETINSIDLYHSTFKPSPYLGVQFVPIPEFTSMGDQVAELIAKALRKEITIEFALKQSQNLVERQMRISGYF